MKVELQQNTRHRCGTGAEIMTMISRWSRARFRGRRELEERRRFLAQVDRLVPGGWQIGSNGSPSRSQAVRFPAACEQDVACAFRNAFASLGRFGEPSLSLPTRPEVAFHLLLGWIFSPMQRHLVPVGIAHGHHLTRRQIKRTHHELDLVRLEGLDGGVEILDFERD